MEVNPKKKTEFFLPKAVREIKILISAGRPELPELQEMFAVH